ncbi:MAG: zf-HC2 domain-containing protein [Gemmatimonadota bacterium]
MKHRTEIRLELLDLLLGSSPPERKAELEAHVAECPDCAAELRDLLEAWNGLPQVTRVPPPPGVRAEALKYARVQAGESQPVLRAVWDAVRGVAGPVALGGTGAAAIVAALHLRGGMAPLDHPSAVALSLALAAVIALASAGLLRGAAPRRVRTVLTGSLGGLGGYVILTLLSPIPDTVEICRIAVFRDLAMSLGEICLVYLGVALLYAGVPMALAAYAGAGEARAEEEDAGLPWRRGLAEAAIFTLLSVPILVLQTGLEEMAITMTALAGLVLGAVVGGFSGTWARARRGLGATA